MQALWPARTYGTLVRANNMVSYVLPAGTQGMGLYGQLSGRRGRRRRRQQVLGWPHRLRRGSVRHLCVPMARPRSGHCRHMSTWSLEHRWFVELRLHEAVGLLQRHERRRLDRWRRAARPVAKTGTSAWRHPSASGTSRPATAAPTARTCWTDVDASQWAIGVDYNLSKRTALYATWSSINNEQLDAVAFSVSTPVVCAVARQQLDRRPDRRASQLLIAQLPQGSLSHRQRPPSGGLFYGHL